MLIKKIYVYLIMFATLMMTIGGSVAVVMALADIASPTPYYMTYEQFKEMKQTKPAEPGGGTGTPVQTETEQQLRAQYDSMVEQEKTAGRQRAVNSLIKSLAWVIIPLPIFIYFQRKVRHGDDAA